MTAIDYAYPRELPWLKKVKALGYDSVIRYYDNGSGKNLTAEEVADIFNAGLSIFTVFESWGGAASFQPSGDAYFNATMASRDSQKALEGARLAGQPKDTTIYFAVDYDCVDPNALTEYFNGVYSVLHPAGYKIGVYGSYKVTTFAGRNWPGVTSRWQTYAWSGGLVDAGADIYQYANGQLVSGLLCDLNITHIKGWSNMAFVDDPDAQAFKDDTDNSILAIKDALVAITNALNGVGSIDAAQNNVLVQLVSKIGL